MLDQQVYPNLKIPLGEKFPKRDFGPEISGNSGLGNISWKHH